MQDGQNQSGSEVSPRNPVELFEEVDWYNLQPRTHKWMVEGLLLRSGSSLLVGKPKAGKSTCAKNFAVAVVKGHNILNRGISTAGQQGRVAYFILEGKEYTGQTIAEQFRALGVTPEESKRLKVFRKVSGATLEQRVQWLCEFLKQYPADLIVLDTLRLFTGKAVKDSNSYDDTIEAMDGIEPKLRKSGWAGHLMVVHHGRKDDEKKNQMLDSCLGSSGLTASFNTIMLVSHPDDDEPLRLISSKQNEVDKLFGDLSKTELLMHPDTGALTLGQTFKDIQSDAKKIAKSSLKNKVLTFVVKNPNCASGEVYDGVGGREENARIALRELVEVGIIKVTKVKKERRYKAAEVSVEVSTTTETGDAPALSPTLAKLGKRLAR
jgi:hypothetical protein